jgi:hypothetical protein
MASGLVIIGRPELKSGSGNAVIAISHLASINSRSAFVIPKKSYS